MMKSVSLPALLAFFYSDYGRFVIEKSVSFHCCVFICLTSPSSSSLLSFAPL